MTTPPYCTTILRHHDPADRTAILSTLYAYNTSKVATRTTDPLAILIKSEVGATVGGLWGYFSYDWLFVELLAIPAALRGLGHGRDLMARAEEIARAEGCLGIWLETFEFQAKGFYEKLGFEPFAALEDHPRGMRRHILLKRLDGA